MFHRNERYWRYQWDLSFVDPNDTDNHVRVTFKTNLTDKATNEHAEFKPYLPTSTASTQRQTDP
eukprot:1335930-Pleurochrysis_carterae.AAC.1